MKRDWRPAKVSVMKREAQSEKEVTGLGVLKYANEGS